MLNAFLNWVPQGVRAAFEFRHDSWHSDDVFDSLRAKNLALCITDSEKSTAPMVMTADYAYFRLRDEGYQEADIARWGDKIVEHTADQGDVFVYFKHEEEGKGAQFARTLVDGLAAR